MLMVHQNGDKDAETKGIASRVKLTNSQQLVSPFLLPQKPYPYNNPYE